jgi:hypothetical protein
MNTSSDGFPIKQANGPVAEAPIDPLSGRLSQTDAVPRVVVICSSCTATLSVKRAYVGGAIQCKQCGHIFTVRAEVIGEIPVLSQPAQGTPAPPLPTEPDTPGLRASLGEKGILDQLAQIIAGGNAARLSHDRLQAEYYELSADRDGLVARLKSVTELLDAMRADLGTIAPGEVMSLASERDELRARAERLRDENRELARRLEQSDAEIQTARHEHDQERVQIALLRDELAAAKAELDRANGERQAAMWLCQELQVQNDELVKAQSQRESEHEAILLAERTDREQLAEEVRALRSNAEETAKVAEQLISASLNPSTGPVPAAFELETVRLQAQELRLKLDEANSLYRLIAHTLDGYGIQIATSAPDDQAFVCLDESNGHGLRPSDLGLGGVGSESSSRR